MTTPQRTVARNNAPTLDGTINPDWLDRARCAGTETDMWFPSIEHPNRRKEGAAKAYCRACPVIDACLDWALEIGDVWAILGGTTPTERRNMHRAALRQRQRAAARA